MDKNPTVGSVQNGERNFYGNTHGQNYLSVFSAKGPSSDGRIKPGEQKMNRGAFFLNESDAGTNWLYIYLYLSFNSFVMFGLPKQLTIIFQMLLRLEITSYQLEQRKLW